MALKKEVLYRGIAVLLLFITISILPTTVIKSYMEYKLRLDPSKKVPTTGYLCMGMSEGERANGWYHSDTLQLAFENAEKAAGIYKTKIANRLKTFVQNPLYCVKFYTIKTATMWAENTYAAIWYNLSFIYDDTERLNENYFENLATEEEKSEHQKNSALDNIVLKTTPIVGAYQKALILILFGVTIIVLIKNRKNLSNELLLLVMTFVGGFLFHTIWEAKSRYIIPYIVVLMPITSIVVEDYIKETIQKIKSKKIKKIGNGENNEIIDSNSNL